MSSSFYVLIYNRTVIVSKQISFRHLTNACNALLYGLPKYQLQRLQYVQNMAARVVCQMSKFQHITPVLQKLRWLPIQYRIIFKILLLVYKSLNGASPSYLAQKLTQSQFLKEHLRRSCLVKILITDHYFYRFIYIALDLIFFCNYCKF